MNYQCKMKNCFYMACLNNLKNKPIHPSNWDIAASAYEAIVTVSKKAKTSTCVVHSLAQGS
jgi:hypothetical protein